MIQYSTNYFIKKGYKNRNNNDPFPDFHPDETIYQPHVYNLANYLIEKDNIHYVIDVGPGNGEKLIDVPDNVKIICIENEPNNIEYLHSNLPRATIIEHNLEFGLPAISKEILQNAIVISSDVIEHIVKPNKYLKGLAAWSKTVPYMLLSTPDRTRARGPESFGPPDNPFHVREWNIDELYQLLTTYGIQNMIGYTVSNDKEGGKETLLAISGLRAVFNDAPIRKTTLAIMTAYNEEDIIKHSIEHLLSQGCDVHVIDNWSNDQTYSIVKSLAQKNKRISFERYPRQKPKKDIYHWKKLLIHVEEVAHKAKHDWVIHNDADEFRVSPWKGVSLVEAISFIDKLGYNAIDFTVIDFRPTKDGYDGTISPEQFFYDFDLRNVPGNLLQIKGWRNKQKVDLATTGGHDATFTGRKLYPLKFTSKHYPLRSSTHAFKKIYEQRLERLDKEEKDGGWHVQYNQFSKNDKFLWNENYLKKYSYGSFNNEYIVERLSGIGLGSSRLSKAQIKDMIVNKNSKNLVKSDDNDGIAISELSKEVDQLKSKIIELSKEIRDVTHSKSWKVTRPMREVVKKLSSENQK